MFLWVTVSSCTEIFASKEGSLANSDPRCWFLFLRRRSKLASVAATLIELLPKSLISHSWLDICWQRSSLSIGWYCSWGEYWNHHQVNNRMTWWETDFIYFQHPRIVCFRKCSYSIAVDVRARLEIKLNKRCVLGIKLTNYLSSSLSSVFLICRALRFELDFLSRWYSQQKSLLLFLIAPCSYSFVRCALI